MNREQRLILACKAALDALEQYELCDWEDQGVSDEGDTVFGYAVASVAQKDLVKQLKRAVRR